MSKIIGIDLGTATNSVVAVSCKAVNPPSSPIKKGRELPRLSSLSQRVGSAWWGRWRNGNRLHNPREHGLFDQTVYGAPIR